jgi:hypothetical protein
VKRLPGPPDGATALMTFMEVLARIHQQPMLLKKIHA